MKKAPGILPSPRWLCRNGYKGLVQEMWAHPEAFAHISQRRLTRRTTEWVLVASTLARKNSGVLPSKSELRRAGYSGLVSAIERCPEAFAHIHQHKKQHTLADWVAEAEQLKKEHGTLPGPGWLVKHGYSTLANMLWKHPGAFAHLPQDRKQRTTEEWVAEAERLAKEHGKLPNPKWLETHGYCRLYYSMRRHPKMFAHIKQGRKYRLPEERVAEAERLVRRHGKVPSRTWLKMNGHAGLEYAMSQYPELFSHIKQDTRQQRQEERMTEAKRLVRKYGKLPHPSWLITNGYRRLYYSLQRYPDAFAKIPRARKRDALAEHVATAERLATKHGKVPNPGWLRKNGHHGLRRALREHPDAFAHIEQLHLRPGHKAR